MKVLLINPPVPEGKNWVREGRCQQWDIWGVPFPPLTLALIAGQIRSLAETLIIDSGPAGLDLEKTLEKIKDYNPDLLILSVATPTIATDLGWFLPRVKETNPQVLAASVGIHVSELPKETLEEFSSLDFVIRSEPEIAAGELVLYLKEKKGTLENIAGLAFRREGKAIVNKTRPFLDNLDKLAFPLWDGVDFDKYRLPILNTPFNLISFARGCPFNCKFCNARVYYGNKPRKRSPEKIVEEIEINLKNYGIRDFLFWTEFVTLDSGYLRKVLELLEKRGLDKKIRWVANSRASGVETALFKEMRKAGCWQVAFGLEFGSDRILKLANKGPNANLLEFEKTVKAAVNAGIVADGHFIMGYPGENEETLRQTIDFAKSLPLGFAHFYAASPFPGSQLYRESLENNWMADRNWRNVNQDLPNLKTPWLGPGTVKKYINLAYQEFYLRPSAVWRIVKMARTPAQFLNILSIGSKFVYHIANK